MTTSERRTSQQEPKPRRGGRRRRVLAVVVMAAALLVLAWQVRRAGPAELLAQLASVTLSWLGILFALTFVRYLVASLRLASITRCLLPVRRTPFVAIVFVSQMLGIAIPGLRVGATVLRAHLAARRFGGGIALHLGPNLLDQLALAVSWLLVALGLAPLLVTDARSDVGPSAILSLLGAVILIALVVLVFKHQRHRLIAWLARPRGGRREAIAEACRRTLESMGTLIDNPRALAVGIGGGVAFVLLTGLTQHLALLAIGADSTWWVAVLAVVVGTSIGTASGSPGGLGVTEAAQVAFLQAHGTPLGAATAAVLLARGSYYLLIIVGGLIGLIWEARRGRLSSLFGE